MRIILVSCILISTCSLTLATEYVEGAYELHNSKKEKRFIFNKSAQIQKLIQGLTSFSSISSSKNIPLPPAPVKSTTSKPPTTTPNGSGVTLAIPDYRSSTPAPQKVNDFDNDLEFLTQYRDNAYAVPETASKSQQNFDRLPPLPQKVAPEDKRLPSSIYLPPKHLISSGLSVGAVAADPLAYSQAIDLSAHQTQLTILPGSSQTYLPQPHVVPPPHISPVTYQTEPQLTLLPENSKTYLSQPPRVTPVTYQSQPQLAYVPQIAPLTYQTQQHLSYLSPVLSPTLTAATPFGYDHYQSFSNNQFSFSNQLLNSAHTQSAYYGNIQSTGAQCACKDYK